MKESGRGEYCVLCSVCDSPRPYKSTRYPGSGSALDWFREGELPVGLNIASCWGPKGTKKEELPRTQHPRGFTSLASTPATPVVNIQHFWDQHLSTWNRYSQSPRITQHSLKSNATFLMSSKRLQQMLKAQEELEQKMQKELEIKAQVEQEMIQLNGELKQIRAKRKQLIEDHCQMQTEIQPYLDSSQNLLGYVPLSIKKHATPNKVWDQQIQQLEQIQWQQQELISNYKSHIAVLRDERLRQQEIQAQLKKKLQALNTIKTVQMAQQQQIKVLQMAEPRAQEEAKAKLHRAQGSFVKEWKALSHQLSNVDLLVSKGGSGKSNLVLEHAADKSILDFSRQVQCENKLLYKEVMELIQESQELEAQQMKLRKQKQQLQLEQCCIASTKRGRQHKLLCDNACQEDMKSCSKTILAPLPGTKPGMNSL